MTLDTHVPLDYVRRESGLYVPPSKRRRYARPIGVDLFAGAGGFSLGFESAGFHVVAALEFDYYAALTYTTNLARWGHLQFHFDTPEREKGFEKYLLKAMKSAEQANKSSNPRPPMHRMPLAGTGWISSHPEAGGCEHFWIADARNVKGPEILDALGVEKGEIDVVFGGPPCQGFSLGGKRNVVDPRNSLVFEFARLVVELMPKALVMENVPGILSMQTPDGVPVLDALAQILKDGGFAGYDALRKALGGAPNAKAVHRGAKTHSDMRRDDKEAGREWQDEDDEAANDERQLSLLEVGS